MVTLAGCVVMLAGTTSSLRRVPVPAAVWITVAPMVLTRFESVMITVSSASASESPFTVMSMFWEADPPSVKVSVPEASVTKSVPLVAVPPVTA